MNHGHCFDIENASGRIAEHKKKAKEREARKRLIAAAPELLKMCKDIDEIIDYDGKLTNEAVAVIKDLKQVIAKAENR